MDYVQRARVAASHPVRDSAEFRRIDALPRRLNSDVPEGWGAELRKPTGTLTLRPLQLQALWELSQCGGLLGDMPIGSGKTLVTLLAGTVLKAERPLLLVPSSLVPKTRLDIAYYGAHFRLPALEVVSYEALSLAKNAGLLASLRPDLICGDEAHAIAKSSSARSKVLRLYARRQPECKYVWLSGTLITRSIKDCAGLSSMALRSGSPYPRDYHTIEAWSWAVDDGVLFEAEPGVLEEWCQPGEHVRDGLRRRVRETRGVVGGSGGEETCPASLTFQNVRIALPKLVTRALTDLRTKWELPGGEELDDPLSQHRAVEQLACGYYLRWTWPRGEPEALQLAWRRARAAWNTAVYHKLKHASEGMTSPLLLYRAAASGRWAEVSWAPWAELRGQCRPRTEAVWVDNFLVDAAAKWAAKHHGIVWVDGPEFGARLAAESGLVYYGGGAGAAEALAALERSGPGTPSIIVSINAHRDGLNLQGPYGEALYTCIPRMAKVWQQSLGRIHRPGQQRDQVDIYLVQHTPELQDALQDARRNADFIYQIQGSDGLLRRGTWLVTSK